MKIPDKTKIQSAGLKIKSLDESLNFYSHLMGFKQIRREANTVFLSATGNGPHIISLTEDKNATPRPPGTTGLFHMAIRLPNREELARVFLRLFNNGVKFQGFSDHLVSEAIYLADPDENGIELYADRPPKEWKWQMGQILMATEPLNLTVLTRELRDRDIWNGIHPDTDMGHIHLNVSNLQRSEEFYNRILGFNISNSNYPGALFFAANGYHHHIGTNIWKSRSGNPPPKHSVGLSEYTIQIPSADYLKQIRQKANDAGLLTESLNDDKLTLLDFDKNKITLTL
jgi:catechol 2,3-dioxygenase